MHSMSWAGKPSEAHLTRLDDNKKKNMKVMLPLFMKTIPNLSMYSGLPRMGVV